MVMESVLDEKKVGLEKVVRSDDRERIPGGSSIARAIS